MTEETGGGEPGDVGAALLGYVRDELLGDDAPPALDGATPLLSSGLVDSLALEQLLFFIEDSYGLILEDEELDAANFETIDAIASLVTDRLAATGA